MYDKRLFPFVRRRPVEGRSCPLSGAAPTSRSARGGDRRPAQERVGGRAGGELPRTGLPLAQPHGRGPPLGDVRERYRLDESVGVEVLQPIGGGGDGPPGRRLAADLLDGTTEQQHRG